MLLAQSEVPIVHDPDSKAGRAALLVQSPELARATFYRFRMRPGADVSCLNLYRPANPTIVAPEASFLDERRFVFAASLAETEQERANPWLLLRRQFADGAVPVVADATSLQYVLHASLGDTLAIDTGGAAPVTLRFVAALRDSVLQGELVMGEEQFVRLFPDSGGFRFFLDRLGCRAHRRPGVGTRWRRREGAAAVRGGRRQHDRAPRGLPSRREHLPLDLPGARGLGLLLGTIGLAAVMFRNVLERRRELALLRAVGYDAARSR